MGFWETRRLTLRVLSAQRVVERSITDVREENRVKQYWSSDYLDSIYRGMKGMFSCVKR